MKRTNVLLDEKKLELAKKVFGLITTKDILDFALSELLRAHDRKNIASLRGKFKINLDLNQSRGLR